MHINLSTIIGLSLSSLIITYLIVWSIEKKDKDESYSTADKLSIAVFSTWAFAIVLDVIFSSGYKFTVVKGIDIKF